MRKKRRTSKSGALFVLDNTPENVAFIETFKKLLKVQGNYRLKCHGRASMEERGKHYKYEKRTKWDIPWREAEQIAVYLLFKHKSPTMACEDWVALTSNLKNSLIPRENDVSTLLCPIYWTELSFCFHN